MPNLLTIPRELRDEVYQWTLLDSVLPSSKSRQLQRNRRRIAFDESDADTHYGEERVRYPTVTSAPTPNALLRCSRQVRAELLDVASRMRMRYRIHISVPSNEDVLYPTWVSVPVFTKRVDVLEVALHMTGPGKAGTLCSFDGKDDGAASDAITAGLALLQRFVERGVHFLSKKKAEKMTVGLLALDLTLSGYLDAQDAVRAADDIADGLDVWLRGDDYLERDTVESRRREDDQIRYLAGRLGRFSLGTEGTTRREWDMKSVIEERDKRKHKVQEL